MRPSLLSAHLLETSPLSALRLLRRSPTAAEVPGMTWSLLAMTTPLPARVPPRPDGVVLMAGWTEEGALDRFLERDSLAERLAEGWSVRLQPLRTYGAWADLPDLGRPEQPVDDDEPVAVITLGAVRIKRLPAFLRASRPAEQQAADDPTALLLTGAARPPRIVSTFSVWRNARQMRDYAVGRSGDAHLRATRAHQASPFHSESVFARFRPYGATGSWRGLSPLTEPAAAVA